MFFSGALGALFMYSILRSRDEHRQHSHGRQSYEQQISGEEPTHQSIPERVAELQRQQKEPCRPRFLEQRPQENATPPQTIYVPREIVREVVVDCSCRCACKAPKKPDIPRSFWSLDQSKLVPSAGAGEAEKEREKRREEAAKRMRYWSLDQGMHADVKASVQL